MRTKGSSRSSWSWPTTASRSSPTRTSRSTCLTTDELKQLWEKDSTVTNLSEINPDLPDTELALFGPGDESGTWEYFTETINGEEGNIRSDYSPSSDDNVIVQGVEGEPGGLGFLGFSYYEQNIDKLGIAPIDGGDGCVTPSAETISGGEYTPLSRPLYMYVNPASLEEPQVAAFLNWTLANAATVAETALIVPPNEEQVSDVRGGTRPPQPPRAERSGLTEHMEAGSQSTTTGAPGPFLGAPERRLGERAIRYLLVAATVISLLTTIGIILSLAGETFLFFTAGFAHALGDADRAGRGLPVPLRNAVGPAGHARAIARSASR